MRACRCKLAPDGLDFGEAFIGNLYSLRCALAHEYGLHNKGKESFFFAYRGSHTE
jgi:hypothetical protein